LAKSREPLAALRQAAWQSLRLRFIYDLANGAGLGLLGVSSVLVADNWRLLDLRRLLLLLVFVPVAHALLMALLQALVRSTARKHYRELFATTELLLIIISAEWPSGRVSGKPVVEGNRLEFTQRLDAVKQRWRELLALAGAVPLPAAWWLGVWPLAQGLLWAALALMYRDYLGLHALTPAIAFALLALHASACRLAIARDQFLLELADELGRGETPPLHSII
jgi:hypothetical protein